MRYDEAQQELRNNPKRWLITGVAGFIGSHLLETLLKLGQQVVGLDNFATGYRSNLDEVRTIVGDEAWSNFSFIEGDIRCLEDCESAVERVDLVLHQAALGSVPRSIRDPRLTHNVNVDGIVNLLLSARDAEVERFIYASSSSIYGDNRSLPKIEDDIGTPLSPYAVSKRVSELYAKTFYDHYNLNTIGLRYFNVFGRRQSMNGQYSAVIPKWISSIVNDNTCHINGDGSISRDFSYVDNVVQANVLAATSAAARPGEVYNIAYGSRATLKELFNEIKSILMTHEASVESVHVIYRDFREGDILHSVADITKAQSDLGFNPTHTLREGLEECIPWYVKAIRAEYELY